MGTQYQPRRDEETRTPQSHRRFVLRFGLVLAGIGLVQVHCLLDAKVWRLREPRQRAIVNERVDFLLGR